ncbi:MAG: acetyl-CoA carboxylase biotin carboxyl carrier protein [Candidatus Puniceispirillum sp.]|nr:acetyl-CoA carboxylase biotin carboxyl carrier protein [Candidatus Puniceispirillum sp.]
MTQETSFKGDLVRQLAEILNDTHLTEIEYEVEDCRVRVARQVQVAATVATAPQHAMPMAHSAPAPETVAAAPAAPQDPAHDPDAVKSPMVGTAYMSPTPGSAAFVKEGDTVTEGQTLLIIEAMKVMNQIKSPRAGVVKKIFVKDTDPIEYGQPLILVAS